MIGFKMDVETLCQSCVYPMWYLMTICEGMSGDPLLSSFHLHMRQNTLALVWQNHILKDENKGNYTQDDTFPNPLISASLYVLYSLYQSN